MCMLLKKEKIMYDNIKRNGSRLFFLAMLFSCLVTSVYGQHAHSDYYSPYYDHVQRQKNELQVGDAVLIVAGSVVAATGVYWGGRIWGWCLYKLACSRYEPEFDLLERAYYNDALIQEELIPYVLEQHDRKNSSYCLIENPYRNYPLLQYKNDLEWYANRLWLSKLLYWDPEKRGEITRLIEKLNRIKRYIVIDYRFVQEQRAFEKENRKR